MGGEPSCCPCSSSYAFQPRPPQRRDWRPCSSLGSLLVRLIKAHFRLDTNVLSDRSVCFCSCANSIPPPTRLSADLRFAAVTTVGGGLADMFDQKERGSAVVVYSQAASPHRTVCSADAPPFRLAVVVGPCLGPIIGSAVSQSSLGWRWTEVRRSRDSRQQSNTHLAAAVSDRHYDGRCALVGHISHP